jgi:hypothetical protein
VITGCRPGVAGLAFEFVRRCRWPEGLAASVAGRRAAADQATAQGDGVGGQLDVSLKPGDLAAATEVFSLRVRLPLDIAASHQQFDVVDAPWALASANRASEVDPVGCLQVEVQLGILLFDGGGPAW